MLSIDQAGVFVGQVSGEFSPVVCLSLFGFLEDVSAFDELLSEFAEKLCDLLDGLGVDVGG